MAELFRPSKSIFKTEITSISLTSPFISTFKYYSQSRYFLKVLRSPTLIGFSSIKLDISTPECYFTLPRQLLINIRFLARLFLVSIEFALSNTQSLRQFLDFFLRCLGPLLGCTFLVKLRLERNLAVKSAMVISSNFEKILFGRIR